MPKKGKEKNESTPFPEPSPSVVGREKKIR